MKKSQAAMEFLFFVGIAIVILMIYAAISFNYLDITLRRETATEAQTLVDTIKNEINLAARVENGYIREVTLPSKVNNKDYVISIEPRTVVINFEGNDYIGLLATDVNAIGSLIPGNTFSLRKENDEVYLYVECSPCSQPTCAGKLGPGGFFVCCQHYRDCPSTFIIGDTCYYDFDECDDNDYTCGYDEFDTNKQCAESVCSSTGWDNLAC